MDTISDITLPRHLDGPSVARAAAALSLHPSNASKLTRLHRIVALGLANSDQKKPPATPTAIRSILRERAIGGPEVAFQDDLYAEPLVHSIAHFGRNYLVSSGLGIDQVNILDSMLAALFADRWLEHDLHDELMQRVQTLLAVSDHVLSRSGLRRNSMPNSTPREAIIFPRSAKMRSLQDAVMLNWSELEEIAPCAGEVLRDLSMAPGELEDPCADDFIDERVLAKPFMRLDHGYLVTAPLDLCLSIRHSLLRSVSNNGLMNEYSRRWREAIFRNILHRLPFNVSHTELEKGQLYDRHIMEVGSEQTVHLILATDAYEDWDQSLWSERDTGPIIDRILSFTDPREKQKLNAARDNVHLVITDSPGRSGFWGIPSAPESDPILYVSSSDLEVILDEEPLGLLGVLLFAQALERRHGQSFSTSMLDDYAVYAENGRSFYLSDNEPASFLMIEPGSGTSLRLSQARNIDRHRAYTPLQPGKPIEFVRMYKSDAPELFSSSGRGLHPVAKIEFENSITYVTIAGHPSSTGGYHPIVNCVAYWIWQCAIILDAQDKLANSTIEIDLGQPDHSESTSEARMDRKQGSAGRADYAIRLPTEMFESLAGRDNRAERALVPIILTTLFGTPEQELEATRDRVAPIGTKKTLVLVDDTLYSQPQAAIDDIPLGSHGQVSAQVLDSLGDWAISKYADKSATASFLNGDRTLVLNAAVGFLFEALNSEVSRLDARQLLPVLLMQSEALLIRLRTSTELLKARLALFGTDSVTVEELSRTRRESIEISRANRFLIEYVAALPPRGDITLSALTYLRMMEIAKEIIARGTASDLLYYGLADFDVSILPSGRIGIGANEPIVSVFGDFIDQASRREILLAAGEVQGTTPSLPELENIAEDSAHAMEAEFGFTLSDFQNFCLSLAEAAGQDGLGCLSLESAVDHVEATTGLDRKVIGAIFECASLKPNSRFMESGPDVFPWRFARNLSFTRRSIIARDGFVYFGKHGVEEMFLFWVSEIVSARLQSRARSAEMREFISSVRSTVNDRFAEDVESRVRRLGFSARLSVKKIGGRRILDDSGNDIGDVDVLGVCMKRKLVIAVEAKDFEVARTPAELSNEVRKIYDGSGRKKGTMELHSRRIEWLKIHLAEILEDFGVSGGVRGWKVEGLVVTSSPLVTPLVRQSEVPVVPLQDLDAYFL